MRRYLPALLVSLACVAPVLGCDLLTRKQVDAGPNEAVATATATAAATDTATAAVTTAAPLTPGAPAVAPGQPAVKPADGGAVADGGAKSDAAAPAPMPQFPGFDAGAFKGFDAGGLFRGFDAGGFKPPTFPK